MTFFLNVTDTGEKHQVYSPFRCLMFATGSWLEIGQSISFFCITSLLLVWSAGICASGEYLMGDMLIPAESIDRKKVI